MISQAGSPAYPLSKHRCCGRVNISGRSMIIESSKAASCDTSWRLAPVTIIDSGTPFPSARRCCLLPGFFPCLWDSSRQILGLTELSTYSRRRLIKSNQSLGLRRIVLIPLLYCFEKTLLAPEHKITVYELDALKSFGIAFHWIPIRKT